jgi:hypothetical protein
MNRHNFILALLIAIFIGFSVQQTFTQQKKDLKKYEKWKKDKIIEFPKPKPKPKQPPTPTPKELSFEVLVEGSGKFECERGTCTWAINRHYSGTVDMGSAVKVLRAFTKTGDGTDYSWRTDLTAGEDMFVSIKDIKVETYTRKKKEKGKDVEETLSFIDTWTTDKTTAKIRGSAEIRWDSEARGFILNFSFTPDAFLTYRKKSEPEQDPPYQSQYPLPQTPVILGCLNHDVFIPPNMSDKKTASFEFDSPPDCYTNAPQLLEIPETNNVNITVTYKFGNKGETKKQN